MKILPPTKISSGVLAVAIFLGLFVAYNATLIKHNNSYCIKQNGYKFLHKRLECLITGMSHAYYGLSPEALGCEALNLANVSQSLGADCAIIKKALSNCPNLKVVMIDISYHSLRYSMFNEPGEPWRDCYSFIYYGVGEANWWQRCQDIKYFVPAFLFGTSRCQKILRHRFKDPSASDVDESNWCSSRGWAQVWALPKFTEKAGAARVALHDSQMREASFEQNIGQLRDVLALCKARGVKVLLFTPPVWKTYSNHINRPIWDETQIAIAGLCSDNVSYANYLKDQRFKDMDFVDDDHLNTAGALKFSNFLKMEYLNRLLVVSHPIAFNGQRRANTMN